MNDEVEVKDPIFCGVFPAGISYADRTREVDGDYVKLAFLSFATLELDLHTRCPPALREPIIKDAALIQARKGEPFRISSSGQTVILGYSLH